MMLEELDAALGRVRRLYDQPDVRAWFQQRLDLEHVDAAMYRTMRAVEQEADGDPSINGIAARLRVDASTASRFVDQAVQAGFVVKTPAADDRRRWVLQLAPEGASLLRELRRVRVEFLRELTHDWSEADIEDLSRLLHLLDAAADRLSERAAQ